MNLDGKARPERRGVMIDPPLLFSNIMHLTCQFISLEETARGRNRRHLTGTPVLSRDSLSSHPEKHFCSGTSRLKGNDFDVIGTRDGDVLSDRTGETDALVIGIKLDEFSIFHTDFMFC